MVVCPPPRAPALGDASASAAQPYGAAGGREPRSPASGQRGARGSRGSTHLPSGGRPARIPAAPAQNPGRAPHAAPDLQPPDTVGGQCRFTLLSWAVTQQEVMTTTRDRTAEIRGEKTGPDTVRREEDAQEQPARRGLQPP